MTSSTISLVFICLVLLCLGVRSFPDPISNGLDMADSRLSFKQQEFMSLNSECNSKKWYCQRSCRFQFFENSGTCRAPAPNESCFGMPIRYNYTWNQAVKAFPRELELLKRFPRCWSALGPLLCSAIYRPCSKNNYIEASMKDTGFIEMWEVFPAQLCHKAVNECSFVREQGIWPEILNCEGNVEMSEENVPVAHTPEQEQRLFNNKCIGSQPDSNIVFPPEQCLWPLVKGPSELADTQNARPFMDSCYMPCETPIAGFDWMLEGFRKRNSMVASVTGTVFMLITLYLMGFSKIYQTSLCVFCLAQSFLCITAYLLFWVISGSKSIRESALCVDNGRIRRHSSLVTLDPCALEALLSTFALIAANFWIFVLLMLRIYRPKIRNDNYFMYGSRGNEMSARTALAALAYLGFPAILFVLTIFLWHDLPVDPLAGICHVGAGSFRHSFILHLTSGLFCVIIVLSTGFVAIQKRVQEYRLERSLTREGIDIEDPSGSPLVDTEVKKTEKSIEDDQSSYATEHGLGDSLFSDYWLGIVAVAFITTVVLATFIQYTIITDIGQRAEVDKIQASIRCSLNSIKQRAELPSWWNQSLNFDHLTSDSDPYVRKAVLFNSAAAPNCGMQVITDGQVFAVFLSAIILPSLPFWIFGVCFFAGFCNNGLRSVRKVRKHLNPFIRDNPHRSHSHRDATEMVTFLSPGQMESHPTKEESIDVQSQVTAAPSGMSAPGRMETTHTTTYGSEKMEKSHDPMSTNSMPSDDAKCNGSVHSEPVREPRKLDLNQKRLQHRRERNKFLQHQNGQTKKLFAIPPTPSTVAAPIRASAPIPASVPTSTSSTAAYNPMLMDINNLFGFPSMDSINSQSSFNMTSISQQVPYYPVPVNMELVAKVQELTAQNTQLMDNNYKALQSMTQMVDSFYKISNNLKVWTDTVSQNSRPPLIAPPRMATATQPMVNGYYRPEPPIARIPVPPVTVRAPSVTSVTNASSNTNNAASTSTSEANGFSVTRPTPINPLNAISGMVLRSHIPPLDTKKKADIPQVRVQHLPLAGRDAETTNGQRVESAAAPVARIAEENEHPPPPQEPWFLPNPPKEIFKEWYRLQSEFKPNQRDNYNMTEDEIWQNAVLRITAHCGCFIPRWLYRTFRDKVADLFDELYTEDEYRSETLSELNLFPDTDPMEAAVEEKLFDYVWPLVCKAIKQTAEDMHINTAVFTEETTEWVTTNAELEKLKTEFMNDDDSSSSSSADSIDESFPSSSSSAIPPPAVPSTSAPPPETASISVKKPVPAITIEKPRPPPPDLEALAQERIDELPEEEEEASA